jgi:peptide deformylase
MIRPIVTDIKLLRKKCEDATEEEAKEIIKDLEDTFATKKGYGLSAPQIGIYKNVAIIRMGETKENLINPKIIDKGNKIVIKEGCMSFPGLLIEVDRYDYVMVEMNGKKTSFVGIEGVVCQHEIAHLNGRTIFCDKHRNPNNRR